MDGQHQTREGIEPCRSLSQLAQPLKGTSMPLETVSAVQLHRAIEARDFDTALKRVKPTVSPESLSAFAEWEGGS